MALYLGKINSQWKVGVLGIVCSCPVEKCGGETGGWGTRKRASQREILRSAPLVTMASLALILLLISAMGHSLWMLFLIIRHSLLVNLVSSLLSQLEISLNVT